MSIRKKSIIFAVLFTVIMSLFGELFLYAFAVRASASESVTYSNVLDDLKKDPEFNPDDYPAKADDYSIKLIQPAEGENGQLYVYIYQPNFETSGLKASYINLSTQDPRNSGEKIQNSLHSLVFLNSNGALCKYLVSGFDKTEETIRTYNVAGIYRPYLEGVDKTYEAIDQKNHVVFEVGKVWQASYYNGALEYTSFKVKTVLCEITASGELVYPDGGFNLYYGACSSHYFAFKIPDKEFKDIIHIFDADVSYKLIPYSSINLGDEKENKDLPTIEKNGETIYDSQEVTHEQDLGIFGSTKYTWKRIQTPTQFKGDVSALKHVLSETELKGIDSAEWVFRITESDYRIYIDYVNGQNQYTYYKLDSAGVLRLHFSTPDGFYNLGAVSDLVGTDGIPDTKPEEKDIFEILEKILSVLLVVAVAVFLYPIVSPFINALFGFLLDMIKLVIRAIFSLFLFPFRLLKKLFIQK